MKSKLQQGYGSPRWTGELTDCSMPMTFDTYSNCGFGCMYCFSQFQRAVGTTKDDYAAGRVKVVNVEKVKRIFEPGTKSSFRRYVDERKVMQWGGLSDPFCTIERQHGHGLKLLKFFRDIEYPISFSTKGTWWTKDKRYTDLFRGATNWHVKVSIITLDAMKAAAIERGVDSPAARLDAIGRIADLGIGGVTLRFRPFIIGVSSPQHEALIRGAASKGADSVSTEFFCLEQRSTALRKKLGVMSELAGYDLFEFYKKHSRRRGYMRLNRTIKRPYVDAMQKTAHECGMRFYVSDADFKERCDGGSCCGLNDGHKWSRGQFTAALLLCKQNGQVTWDEVAEDMDHYEGLEASTLESCQLFGGSAERCARFKGIEVREALRSIWNNPKTGHSPYQMFGGVMKPARVDDNGNVIYEYDSSRE